MLLKQETNLQKQSENTLKLIERLLPEHHKHFQLYPLDHENGLDVFEIYSQGSKIFLGGSSAVAWASALNWYLKYYCNVHFSWCGDQLQMPDSLPQLSSKIHRTSPHKYRYYLNYCTFSYSMAWWDWPRWEREIDWMALNGINMPLAVVGHEAIWQKLLLDFGFSNREVYNFFAGPAYRAWGWMGNIENWGGPLTQNWIDDQMELQNKILERERMLGMTPVLHSFSGHVPQKFKDLFPQARIKKLPSWYGYPGNYFLDPDDSLFKEMCSKYMKHQVELYGTDHFYITDLFHELELTDNKQEDLNRMSRALLDNMLENDPEAVWIMQSWSLREKILTDLPAKNVLVLDLYCDSDPKWKKTEAFYDKPWIWCMLHNFGGRTGMSGKLQEIAREPALALASTDRGKLSGIGIAPEGILNNPVIYDLMAEMAWRDKPVELTEWIAKYSHRRYGIKSESLVKAWEIMIKTVYSGPESYGPLESEICARPALDIKKVSSNGSTALYYDPSELAQALPLFLKEHQVLKTSETYRYDLVDLARQVYTDYGRHLYKIMISAVENKDSSDFSKAADQFLGLILDLDEMLSTHEQFLFGRWIDDARKKGKDPEEKKLLEWNASTQVTLWSSPEIAEFHDYANKQWAGLLKGYYYKRWEMFKEYTLDALQADKPFDPVAFRSRVLEWEARWSFSEYRYPVDPVGDTVDAVLKLFEKMGIPYPTRS